MPKQPNASRQKRQRRRATRPAPTTSCGSGRSSGASKTPQCARMRRLPTPGPPPALRAPASDGAPEAEEAIASPVPKPGGNAEATVTEAQSAVERAPGAAPAVEPAPAVHSAGVQSPAKVLIDSVPWKKATGAGGTSGGTDTAAAAGADAAAAPLPVPAIVPATPSGYAALHNNQAFHNGQAFDNDHDGQTVMKSSIGASPAQPAPAGVADPQAGPTVLDRVCSQGHANPPTRAQCAACGAGPHPDAVQVPRAPAGTGAPVHRGAAGP